MNRDPKIRVTSDAFEEAEDNLEGFGNVIPVDMYGKRVFPKKDDPANMENAARDIQERYGLTGDAGLSYEDDSKAEEDAEA